MKFLRSFYYLFFLLALTAVLMSGTFARAEGFDSMQKHQDLVYASDSYGLAVWNSPIYGANCRVVNPSDFKMTNIALRKGQKPGPDHMNDWLAYGLGIQGGALLVMGAATGGIGLALTAAAEALAALYICAYTWVFTPPEYYAWRNNISIDAPNTTRATSSLLDTSELPYYFHCDPLYVPSAESQILDTGQTIQQLVFGRTWGYPGPVSSLCAHGASSAHQMPDMVAKIAVGVQDGFLSDAALAFGKYSYDLAGMKSQTYTAEISPNDDMKWVHGVGIVAYYKITQDNPPLKICAGIATLPVPIEIGCTTASIMNDYADLPSYLQQYVNSTRCKYMHDMRTDLASLANSSVLLSSSTVPQKDADNYSGLPVSKFLRSDMHFTSNTIGCIKDLLVKKFVGTPGSTAKNYIQLLQAQIAPMVYAVFVLYVSLLGIKIISSTNPPSRGEWIMYVLKLAIIAYFILGDGWYSTNTNRPGLFKPLVNFSDQIADFFMQAQVANDYLGLCRFKYNGKNLLGENEVSVSAATLVSSLTLPASAASVTSGASTTTSGLIPTAGFDFSNTPQVVKLSVWDLVDCRIANYLTMGSCDYTASGLMAIWFIVLALFSAYGVLVMLLSFIYALMLFLVVFRFAHIFILSMLTIGVLVFVSPIFLCFGLFQQTKSIFESWVKQILGFILYPALLFGFLVLMLATFDAVYYGNVNINKSNPQDFRAACKGVSSAFCQTILNFTQPGDDVCQMNWTRAIKGLPQVNSTSTGQNPIAMIKSFSLSLFGNFWYLTNDAMKIYATELGKLVLIAVIFYHFMDEIVNFMAVMLGILDIGQYARGRANLISAGMGVATGAKTGLQSVRGLGRVATAGYLKRR